MNRTAYVHQRRCGMRIIPGCLMVITAAAFASGCCGGRESVVPFRSFGGYAAKADAGAKSRLEADLRSGKAGLGSSAQEIKKNYGEPDEISARVDSARFVYKRGGRPSIVLWFDSRGLLSSWSD